jgi:hypothetical protein
MRKEIVFALLSGSILGIVLAFGVIRARSAVDTVSFTEEILQEVGSVKTEFNNDVGLTITTPKEADVLTTPNTAVTGYTINNSVVTITTEEDDYIFLSDEEGNFEHTINLKSGVNTIMVNSFSDSKVYEANFMVVYSSEFSKVLGINPDEEADI